MNKIELLAPAGSMESLYAAVQSGADAVYLGGSKFSARAYASNFDEEGMRKAVEYCHLYGVKIYVTVNTLMKDKELKEALKYVRFLYEVGVDALIIQDLGLASAIRKSLPDFELHASTQMTVHNGEGAKFLKDLGFKRIVLSRELSIKEIEYISKELNIETEIFVHGALCVSYSGQCLMSSLIGGRSGNRGRCAQPCRLPYTLVDKINNKERKGYLLSPKDICTLEEITSIVNSGTTSLKIEGRMKRPEYVAGVVSAYRKALDNVLGVKSKVKFNVEKENKNLLQLFNREGFSKAYLFKNVGRDMMAYSFPKNTGVALGKVQKDLTVLLEEDLSVKDGVRNKDKGFTVLKIFKDGKEVIEASKGSKVKIKPADFKIGDLLYKTSDVNLLKSMEEKYKSPYEKKIDLNLEVEFKIGEPIKLRSNYKNRTYIAEGDIVQKAIKRPIEQDKLKELLSKSGDTPFKFYHIKFSDFQEGFLPVSAINEVRRNITEQIEKENLNVKRCAEPVVQHGGSKEISFSKYMICVNSLDQLRAAKECGFKDIAIDLFCKNSDITKEHIVNELESNIWLKIPNIIKEEFDFVCSEIDGLIPHISGIVTANLGIISKFNDKINIIGDYKLNLFNKEAVNFYNNIVNSSCLSVELNRQELNSLSKKMDKDCFMLVYGKIENMVSEYCVIGSTFGEKSSKKACNRACEKGQFYLKDRMGENFTVETDKFCRCHIYNNVPLNLIDNIDEIENMGINHFRIDFVDEDYSETLKVLKAVKSGKWEHDFKGYTRGHYKRGVE